MYLNVLNLVSRVLLSTPNAKSLLCVLHSKRNDQRDEYNKIKVNLKSKVSNENVLLFTVNKNY